MGESTSATRVVWSKEDHSMVLPERPRMRVYRIPEALPFI